MNTLIEPVSLERASRLLNHGPTVLVSATHAGVSDVMAAAWACVLESQPPRFTVVLDKASATRDLIERSGYFALQVPAANQLELVDAVGHMNLRDESDKLRHCGVQLFEQAGSQAPLVQGCSAWLACRLIPEPHNQQTYDLFIGEAVGAWADSRAFANGYWKYEQADPDWRSLHHAGGGTYYAIGEALRISKA
ncbi:MAG: flavin reductase family protein [Brachymonas sp.]|nr:flavin reductase family protein [Brachymonas sp.]